MMGLSEDFDKQKMLEVLVDPDVSSILSELEGGEKDSVYLSDKLQVPVGQIKDRLSYVMEHKFVLVRQDGDREIFAADLSKLNKIMENDDNFANVVDGLTELDQFLN